MVNYTRTWNVHGMGLRSGGGLTRRVSCHPRGSAVQRLFAGQAISVVLLVVRRLAY